MLSRPNLLPRTCQSYLVSWVRCLCSFGLQLKQACACWQAMHCAAMLIGMILVDDAYVTFLIMVAVYVSSIVDGIMITATDIFLRYVSVVRESLVTDTSSSAVRSAVEMTLLS
jgi:hypothetical protein